MLISRGDENNYDIVNFYRFIPSKQLKLKYNETLNDSINKILTFFDMRNDYRSENEMRNTMEFVTTIFTLHYSKFLYRYPKVWFQFAFPAFKTLREALKELFVFLSLI